MTSRYIESQKSWWPADGSLPPHVAEFVEWLVLPKWERPEDERSQVAWAKKHGFDRMTLTAWKKDKRVKAAIEKRCDELNLSPDRAQEVMNAIFRAATEGDMKAAQLFLQHADRLKPNRVVIEDRRIADLSDDELRDEMSRLGLLAGDDQSDG